MAGISADARPDKRRTASLPGIQAAFFNGIGYADQQDVIGVHNGFTPSEAEALRNGMTIERAFAGLRTSADWEPHASTRQFGVFSSKFPGANEIRWTLVNRNDYSVDGD